MSFIGRKARFWIKSNRGTDQSETVTLKTSLLETDIKYELEEWCEQFGAWHHSDNVVDYGFAVLPEN